MVGELVLNVAEELVLNVAEELVENVAEELDALLAFLQARVSPFQLSCFSVSGSWWPYDDLQWLRAPHQCLHERLPPDSACPPARPQVS